MSHESQPPVNPYAPVTAEQPMAAPVSQAEQIRKQYLNHEASVKSIGVLYLLGSVFLVLAGIVLMVSGTNAMITNAPNQDSPALMIIIGAVELAVGVLYGMTGWAIRSFKHWARMVAIVFSALGLLGFPIGTLISGYFLYLLVSKKGVYVFTDEYQQIIAATPHVKYKTSIVVWILLGLLLVLLGMGLIAAVASRFS